MSLNVHLISNLTETDYIQLRRNAWDALEGWGWERTEYSFWGQLRKVIDVYTHEERLEFAEELFQWMVRDLQFPALDKMAEADLFSAEPSPATPSPDSGNPPKKTEPHKDPLSGPVLQVGEKMEENGQ